MVVFFLVKGMDIYRSNIFASVMGYYMYDDEQTSFVCLISSLEWSVGHSAAAYQGSVLWVYFKPAYYNTQRETPITSCSYFGPFLTSGSMRMKERAHFPTNQKVWKLNHYFARYHAK